MIRKYLRYFAENPEKYWFKRKRYGWGWVPVRWEGWLVVLLYIVAMTSLVTDIDAHAHSMSDALINLVFPFFAGTSFLTLICYATGETPRWQWGDDHSHE